MDNEIKTDLRTEAENYGEGNITVRKNKTVDFIAKIVCLLLAFFLWYYASSSDTVIYDKEYSSIPVTIENSSDLSLLSGDGMTVDVTLSGKRNDLRKINNSDIRAYVVIPENATAGRHEFDIKFDIPGGVTLEKTSVSSIVVYVDNSITKMIPVKVNLVSFNYEKDCELRIGSIPAITISGPAQIVETISHASLPVDMGNQLISKSVSYRGELVLIDQDGEEVSDSYIKLSSATASVTLSVYKEKTVPILVKFKYGFITQDSCRITLSRNDIKVYGEAEKVNNMVIECVIDEKTLKDNVAVSCGIGLPTGVTSVDNVYNVSVTVDLKNVAEKNFTVLPEVVNGTVVEPISPIEVTIRGSVDVISAITEEDIRATVDLYGMAGVVTLPVSFDFEGDFSGKVYEIYDSDEPYEVKVTVSDNVRKK